MRSKPRSTIYVRYVTVSVVRRTAKCFFYFCMLHNFLWSMKYVCFHKETTNTFQSTTAFDFYIKRLRKSYIVFDR